MNSPLRFLTAGELLHTTLYIQFSFNLHDVLDLSSLFVIGGADLTDTAATAYCFSDTGAFVIRGGGGFNIGVEEGVVIDEWNTAQIALNITPPNTALVSGNLNDAVLPIRGAVNLSLLGVLGITQFAFGAVNTGGSPVNHHIKDITMGTGGFGSDNIFSFNLNRAILSDSATPQFDSVTGDGVSIDAEGILFENEGTDVYATKALIFP